MPTTRQRRPRAQRPMVSPALRHWLLTGEYGNDDGGDSFQSFLLDGALIRGDIDRVRAPWNEIRAHELQAWIRRRPGTRPWAWWVLGEAPEPRRRVDGQSPSTTDLYRCRFGLPTWVPEPTLSESQATFLRRHGLLTDSEVGALATTAFDPELVATA